MAEIDETQETQSWTDGAAEAGPQVAGVVMIFSAGRAAMNPIPLRDGVLSLGRGSLGRVEAEDPCMSRRHVDLALDGRSWRITDRGSRNGSALDGEALRGEVVSADAQLLRCGETLFLLSRDLRPYLAAGVEERDGVIVGPTLRDAWERVARAARSGDSLHLSGESGSGKELAARYFHDVGHTVSPARPGPFVAVNCATIPQALAERILFGARKGAYSGADSDAEGLVQAAHGGTLFLDEIAELDQAVQAKLLRVLETHEVVALGASKPRPVEFRICSATHRELRTEVAQNRFREDLYFRVGRPRVALPPLRARPEDVPWLIQRQLRQVDPGLAAHVSLVEACLLRRWPGNVRELTTEVKSAAREAVALGRNTVESSRLGDSAGSMLVPRLDAGAGSPAAAPAPDRSAPEPARIEEALRRESGNVSRAARRMGVHRTQLRRWIERFHIDPRQFFVDDNTH